jgi:hypothetical protein
LAEGVSDERAEVRVACAHALCDCVSDRHAQAVPPGVLIDVLVHVLVPVIRVLGDLLLVDWHSQLIRSSSPAPPPSPAPHSSSTAPSLVQEKDWVSVEHGQGDNASATLRSSDEVVLHCVNTLGSVFQQHVRKLADYPSFDKLWLQILQLLGYFLEVRSEELRPEALRSLKQVVDAAQLQLKELLQVLEKGGVFKRKEGLWMVTRDYLQQLRDCDQLLHVSTS